MTNQDTVTTINITIPRHLVDKIDRYADRGFRSRSQQVAKIIHELPDLDAEDGDTAKGVDD